MSRLYLFAFFGCAPLQSFGLIPFDQLLSVANGYCLGASEWRGRIPGYIFRRSRQGLARPAGASAGDALSAVEGSPCHHAPSLMPAPPQGCRRPYAHEPFDAFCGNNPTIIPINRSSAVYIGREGREIVSIISKSGRVNNIQRRSLINRPVYVHLPHQKTNP